MPLKPTLAAACFLMIAAGTVPASAAPQAPSASYISARTALRQTPLTPITARLLADIQQNPTQFAGKALEGTATVSGQVVSDGQRTVLLNIGNDSISVVLPASLQKADWIDTGCTLRVLLSVEAPGARIESNGLRLISAAPEYDVAQSERAAIAGWTRRVSSTSRSVSYDRNAQSTPVAGVGAPSAVRYYAAPPPVPRVQGHPIAALTDRALSIYGPYRDAIRSHNPRLSETDLDKIATSILFYCDLNQVDPRLVMAMVIAESGFNIYSTSRTGAQGLGQLMPSTARGMGVTNAYDPIQNIQAAVRILRGHLDKYGGAPANAGIIPLKQLRLTMAAYNAGPGAVRKYHGVPPYRETQRYVAKVGSLYQQMCGIAR
ncbi:MAG: putative soluble lytic transglycosylase fused to an ABC-type amino acid-binding protein [Capsulimonas sp.]|nr:putative soluble lytic transglycosylase fused to an ABC-type amino acid-binding protein [Capsulimonas sp.]